MICRDRSRFLFGPSSLAALVLISSLLLFFPSESRAEGPASPQIGKSAPDFNLKDRYGVIHRLSDYVGNVVLLNFWATWCPSCQDEISTLDGLSREYQAEDFLLIGISQDVSWLEVDGFFNKRYPSFLIVLDATNRIVGDLYHTYKFPESYVIDRKGLLRRKIIGSVNGRYLELSQLVKQLLSEK